MTTRILESKADIKSLIALIESRRLPMTVTVLRGKHRSTEQNKLQRLWTNEASEQLGDRTAEEVRGYCKLHLGVAILRRDNPEFREKYDRIIKPFPYETKLELMMVPMDFPVTRLMTTKQKAEYLDAMYAEISSWGVYLTDPNMPS